MRVNFLKYFLLIQIFSGYAAVNHKIDLILTLMKSSGNAYAALAYKNKNTYSYESLNVIQDILNFLSSTQVSLYSLVALDRSKDETAIQVIGKNFGEKLYGVQLVSLLSGIILTGGSYYIVKKLIFLLKKICKNIKK